MVRFAPAPGTARRGLTTPPGRSHFGRPSTASRRVRPALQTVADAVFAAGGHHRREICRMLPPVLLWARNRSSGSRQKPRWIGRFSNSRQLMDYELMGGDARAAIIAETEKRGMKAFLPPAVPFGSKQWPTLITPGPGPTSLADVP